MDFEDINIVGIIFAVIGGMVSVFITKQMGGGLILKLIGFVITAFVGYLMASKIIDG